jgi:hypothetical protein
MSHESDMGMGRGLDDDFIKQLKGPYKDIIEYKKKRDNIFFGIRNNYINLYVCGGSLLKIEKKDKDRYIASVDSNYVQEQVSYSKADINDSVVSVREQLEKINGKSIENISDWVKLLDKLQAIVVEYQYGRCTSKKPERRQPKLPVHREKILQQNIVQCINQKNSKYFAYDMEYTIEGAKDYRYSGNGIPICNRNPVTMGRADILVAKMNDDNCYNIIFVEVKDGTGAYGGVKGGIDNKEKETFGSGVAGHIKNYVPIINLINNNKCFSSKLPKAEPFNIRERMMDELTTILRNYQELGLMDVDSPYCNIDTADFQFGEAELLFFLGDYKGGKDLTSFEKHLGINGGKARYSVAELLDNNMVNDKKYPIDLDFIKKSEMITFQCMKSTYNYENENELSILQKDIDFSMCDIYSRDKF